MALKKSEIYSTITKCTNKLRSNSGISAESFKNYVLILLFLKYISDKVKSGEDTIMELPDGCTFDDIVALKGKKNIGEKINEIIAAITEANELQDYIILTDHDFCDKKLGNAEDSSKLISELVSAFQDDGLDFSQNRAADDDLIGDAYEFLMRNFASQAGKDKGQFYTPTEVSRLIALLIGIDLDDRHQVSVYDPTCGSGSLLLRVKAAAKHDVSLDGQDIDPANIELSYLNMVIHGCETADIKVGDTLNNPQHVSGTTLNTYNYVVSNPKFSLHNWMNGAKENDVYGRWEPNIGVPPQQYGDFAFLLHCLKSLKDDGVCAIILPKGVLTRGGEEERIRKWLVEQRLLKGIIAFPANAFFGTSIAGNVLILDKKRTTDGVFFIDGSELGYKDSDSKIRLREQDIKRVIDVWRARKDVPYFAHLATYKKVLHEGDDAPTYEIEHNNFALNLSLYVTPVDKEIHQNIDGHLHGGIPAYDIEGLQQYWDVCPSLKSSLFKPLREGFFTLAIEKYDVSKAINEETSFKAQADTFANTIEKWCNDMRPQMHAIGKDNDPKTLIAEWGQNILDTFKKCDSLVNAYDVFDQLLIYYNESLQDDLYMISRDGWMPKLIIPAKKTVKWSDLQCDLLPVELAVKVFLNDLKAEYDSKQSALADVQERMANLVEENEDDFDDSLFFGKLNASNLKKKLQCCAARQLNDDEVELLNSMMQLLERNSKEDKTIIKQMRGTREYLFEPGKNVTKTVVKKLLESSAMWQYSTDAQRNLWQQYLDLLDEEKKAKDEIKEIEKKLLIEIKRTYEELTEDEARDTIVNKKWLGDIKTHVSDEMQTAMHNIVTEVTAMAGRYESTLGTLSLAFSEKEMLVMNHLKKMGFEL